MQRLIFVLCLQVIFSQSSDTTLDHQQSIISSGEDSLPDVNHTCKSIGLDNQSFYTPPHFSVGVLCYTFWCLSVRPSVLTISDR